MNENKNLAGDNEEGFNFGADPETTEGGQGENPAASPSEGVKRNESTVVSDANIKDPAEFVEATKDIVPLTPEERRLSKKQLLTKRFLDGQPKVPIFIPLEKGEPKGTLAYFATNGYKFYVQKGLVVNVPKDIAERYFVTQGAESSALNDHKMNLANAGEEKINRLTR